MTILNSYSRVWTGERQLALIISFFFFRRVCVLSMRGVENNSNEIKGNPCVKVKRYDRWYFPPKKRENSTCFYIFSQEKKNSQLDILLFIRVALLYHLSFLSYSFQTAHVLRDVKKFRKRFLPIEVLSFFFFFFSKNESMNLYDIISMSNEVIVFCNSISFLNVLCNCDISFFFFFFFTLVSRSFTHK